MLAPDRRSIGGTQTGRSLSLAEGKPGAAGEDWPELQQRDETEVS